MAKLCKNCAGTLIFDPDKQKLVCKICGSTFLSEDVEDVDKELLAESGKLREANIFVCNHCGSEIELNDSESSSFCLYCGNPAIVFDRIAKTKQPDLIIPFKITREQAQETLEKKLRKSRRLDRSQKNFEVEKISGIYIPYWLISGKLYDSYEIKTDIGSDDSTHIVYTSISGTMDVDSMPIYGSDKLPDVSLGQIDQWDMTEAVPFDEEYLSGFYSDVTDISYSDIQSKASKRSDEIFKAKTRTRAQGTPYGFTASAPVFELTDTPRYIFLPVWFVTLDNKDGTRSTFMMNGQTGQSVGTFPVHFKEMFVGLLWKTLVCLLITAVLALIISKVIPGLVGYLMLMDFALFMVEFIAMPFLILIAIVCTIVAGYSSNVNRDEKKTTDYSSKRKEA
ncbi:hypothetical protein SAMN05216413_0150 [Ruminococcaceae bacterium KH2T8]|nr:hypothetical protein SAMN05216413_0150 [Ruminococcaceae bacterium KH2T8]